jgi:hypothetical protein
VAIERAGAQVGAAALCRLEVESRKAANTEGQMMI